MLKLILSGFLMGVVWAITADIFNFNKDWVFLVGFFCGTIMEKFVFNPMIQKQI